MTVLVGYSAVMLPFELVGQLVELLWADSGDVDQPYLFQARQMQALSLGVHIPLVCFGIAFSAMVLYMEGLRRRGHRNHSLVRAGAVVAKVHGPVRRGIRDGLRCQLAPTLHRDASRGQVQQGDLGFGHHAVGE